jgi:hypothetical protein
VWLVSLVHRLERGRRDLEIEIMAKVVAMLVAMALVVAVMSPSEALTDNCDPGHLAECMPTINGGSMPTMGFCSNLRAQQSCFCEYV